MGIIFYDDSDDDKDEGNFFYAECRGSNWGKIVKTNDFEEKINTIPLQFDDQFQSHLILG